MDDEIWEVINMQKRCSIIMYHYIRELPYTRYPEIKGLKVSQFKAQLDYMQKYYQFVTMNDLIFSIYEDKPLPNNAALLTFDDAYSDHYSNVFPILNERNIQGCFIPPVKAITQHEVLDVNKIHFILASVKNIQDLVDDVYYCMDKYKDLYQLKTNQYYFDKLAVANRFDCKEVIFVKRLLQVELEETLRNKITNELFTRYVTDNEEAFSRELYMNIDQMKCMVRNGMYIGSHGYDHYWQNSLSADKQEQEIDKSIEFLKSIGSSTDNWAMCYPYGAYNQSLIDILKRKGCKLALTTKVGIADININNAYTLERLDTNDLPKESNAEIVEWTRKVIDLK